MKRIIIFSFACLLLLAVNVSGERITGNAIKSEGAITVLASPDMVKLSTLWAQQYQMAYPEMKINILEMSGEHSADLKASGVDLGVISKGYLGYIDKHSIWQMAVGRDVIVPVISSKNPFIDLINEKGVSPEKFASIFNQQGGASWDILLGNNVKSGLNFYHLDDEMIDMAVADFLKIDRTAIQGSTFHDPSQMIDAMSKDPSAVGFLRLVDIIDLEEATIISDVKLLPIDRNSNDKIDSFEQIYESFTDLTRGIWIGKYPRALVGEIYTVSTNRPENAAELAFLKWILADGQKYLSDLGYCDLEKRESLAKMDQLYETNIALEKPVIVHAKFKAIILSFLGIIILGLLVSAVMHFNRKRKLSVQGNFVPVDGIFTEQSVRTPGGLFFDKSHTWAFMEKDGYVRIGIDDFIQHITGTITRIEMKNPGEKVKKGDVLFSLIQQGKQLNIKSPISGKIVEKNRSLLTSANLINTSPYSEGWIYTIEPVNWLKEIQFMIMAEKYREWLRGEFTRLKDFFAMLSRSSEVRYAHVALQDGGELKDGLLKEFGPEVWEDFQSNFIEKAR